jgi:hypothetical protein
MYVCIYICMYMYVYVCIYIISYHIMCMYVYIYRYPCIIMYIYIHMTTIHVYTNEYIVYDNILHAHYMLHILLCNVLYYILLTTVHIVCHIVIYVHTMCILVVQHSYG